MSELKDKLEDSIDLGYQWIEKIEEEYRSTPREKNSELLDKYYQRVREWEEQTKKILPNNAKRRAFSNAKSKDGLYEAGKNPQVQKLVKNIRAKIEKLEEFKREEMHPAHSFNPVLKIV